ncbi:MAG: histidine--tRNA ligase, partial [Defluviitaleaceae bacterium]|nr:histidine--tRNA ligase [Defluviitaleaceae bacterium]
MLTQAPRGTKDLFGEDMVYWRRIENILREICGSFGFTEISTPIFEHTELFNRSVGETSDVAQKEMYTFNDKGGRSISLRPEMTAGAARMYVEHGMHNVPQPVKIFYIGPNFRYETPQSGRLRQHHQFGIEIFGAENPAAEAEIISLGHNILTRLGISNEVRLHINSIGCPVCRADYLVLLKKYLSGVFDSLCENCRQRFEKNPLRSLDCKESSCEKIMRGAPSVLDSLDENCKNHFETLKGLLSSMGIVFYVDEKIVRGLDYYTRTVFEFIPAKPSEKLPAFTVIGGGRYDNLIEECGGARTPGAGFGMGIERLLLWIKELGK